MLKEDSDYIHIIRVGYGKDSTPEKLREYRLFDAMSPVGFVDEWKAFAMKHGYAGVKIEEKDGTIHYEV